MFEEYEYPGCYLDLSLEERKNGLFETFQEFTQEWNPRAVTGSDLARVRKTILDCQSSFPSASTMQSWGKQRQVGYYANNKYKGSQYPQEIAGKVSTASQGIVLSDDWNDFTLLIESKNALSMFCWFTGA